MTANSTAQRLDAILDERRITYVQFAGMLTDQGYRITPKALFRAIGPYRQYAVTRRHVTPDMITAAARALDVPVEVITG